MKIFLFSFIICLSQLSWGQGLALRFQAFGIREGLPNQSIQALYQDQLGYLWIGTWDGLCRYDGYRFQTYQREPLDSTSLAANDVKCILEDGAGRLFIGSQGGLSLYQRQTDDFYQFPVPEGIGRAWNVQAMSLDEKGELWLNKMSSPARLMHLKAKEQWEMFAGQRGKAFMWEKAKLWTAYANQGVKLASPRADSLSFESWAVLAPLREKKIQCIFKDKQDRIWLGARGGLYFVAGDSLVEVGDSAFAERSVLCLVQDQQARIWVGTNDGLFLISPSGKQLANDQIESVAINSLQDVVILSLLVDTAGNLWVGTSQAGLYKVNLASRPRFQAYRSSYFQASKLTVFAFAEGADNRLWLGTTNGLYLLDKQTKAVLQHYQKGPADSLGLSQNVIMSLYETAEQKLMIGYGRSPSLDILDWRTQAMQQLGEKAKLGTLRKILPLSYPQDQFLLLGSSVNYWDPLTQTYSSVKLRDTLTQQIVPSYSWDAYQAKDSILWIANKRGLLRLDPRTKELRLLPVFPDSYRADNTVIAIWPDIDDSFWLGTYGAGLVQVDQSGKVLASYTKLDGLPNNFVIGVLPDSSGHLWMSTNLGIARLDTNSEVFQNFRARDGLMDEEFATGAYLQSLDGEIYMGGSDGFVAFYPSQIERSASQYVPPLYLKPAKVSAPPLREDSLGLHLTAYRGQRLDLSFVALDYSDPTEIRYQWQLEGWEKAWQYPSADPKVSYTNLPPGEYVFRLRASNSDGVFNGPEIRLPIEIKPRLDQHWGFRLGLVGLGILLVASLVYFYLWRLREREKQALERRIAHSKQESLASQMDQHFLFNSLNSIQRFVLENRPKEAGKFISRFGRLIRLQLQQASQALVSIEEELNTLDLYLSLEQLRTRQKFVYEINTGPELDIYQLEIPPGLLQPYLENAIWHGLMPKEEEGLLQLNIQGIDKGYRIEIIDNGIGREASERFKANSSYRPPSKGMSITKERISMLNALHEMELSMQIEDLQKPDGQVIGTKVSLIVTF
ncbi:MAG: two-component regulator propeller domain-containing protein [Bacteroidota bacterium]